MLLGGLGVLAGTVVDMTDPQTSLRTLLPGWFYPVFLLLIVAGAMTNNVLTAYSTGLALQAVGIGWRRSGGGHLRLGHRDRHHQLRAVPVGLPRHPEQHPRAHRGLPRPSLAIYGVDIWLRRNRYDGLELHDETPGSRFWYWRGVNPAGRRR